eukprot:3130723-Rhodomonas_salina.1
MLWQEGPGGVGAKEALSRLDAGEGHSVCWRVERAVRRLQATDMSSALRVRRLGGALRLFAEECQALPLRASHVRPVLSAEQWAVVRKLGGEAALGWRRGSGEQRAERGAGGGAGGAGDEPAGRGRGDPQRGIGRVGGAGAGARERDADVHGRTEPGGTGARAGRAAALDQHHPHPGRAPCALRRRQRPAQRRLPHPQQQDARSPRSLRACVL